MPWIYNNPPSGCDYWQSTTSNNQYPSYRFMDGKFMWIKHGKYGVFYGHSYTSERGRNEIMKLIKKYPHPLTTLKN